MLCFADAATHARSHAATQPRTDRGVPGGLRPPPGTLRWGGSAQKAQQHQRLAEELRTAGWRVEYTPHTAISLGVAGTIHKDLIPLLTDLGVSHHHARTCCDALHDHAVSSLNNIVLARRRLEKGQPLGDPGGS